MKAAFVCDRCGAATRGKEGDQRDPGPYLDTGWSEIRTVGYGEMRHLCNDCGIEFDCWLKEH